MTLIAALDLETTGLLAPDQRIIEIYVGVWELETKSLIREFEQRIDPQRSIAAEAQRVHGISSVMLSGCPTWDFVAPDLVHALDGVDLVVAHNGDGFDKPFIEQEMKRVKVPFPDLKWYDTMTSLRCATPNGKVPNLGELCFAFDVEYDPSKAHAASYDVKVMAECFFRANAWGWVNLEELKIG